MALNAFVDSFLPQSEKVGTERVKLNLVISGDTQLYGSSVVNCVCSTVIASLGTTQ